MAVRRATRLLLRVAGWLLTPLILVVAAGVGAAAGLLISSGLSVEAGLAVTLAMSLIAAIVALMFWARLLRDRPRLRHILDITPEGLPDTPSTDPADR